MRYVSDRESDLYEPGQAEVCDLHDIGVRHEHVPSGEVAVDVVLRLQVRHAGRDLRRHVDQLLVLQPATFAWREIIHTIRLNRILETLNGTICRNRNTARHDTVHPYIFHEARFKYRATIRYNYSKIWRT